MKSHKITLLPGDGIGPEITSVTKYILEEIGKKHNFNMIFSEHLIGGAAIKENNTPLPKETLESCKESDAVLMAAIGSPEFDNEIREKRPETGLLNLRAGLDLFANIRPIKVWEPLITSSSLKPDIITGVDLIVVRELTGGIYFGQPRGEIELDNVKRAFNTMTYSSDEIDRIIKVAFSIAKGRSKRICSVDKANVLEVSQLWRDRVELLNSQDESVEINHMYVDNAAMQLIKEPRQFDVLLTPNLFGDILSDEAAMITGSIGMLPSASLSEEGKPGLFEPVHGSAPDIAGLDKANPIAMVLSAAMMLRIGLKETKAADQLEDAVNKVLRKGIRTQDLLTEKSKAVGCKEMGNELLQAL